MASSTASTASTGSHIVLAGLAMQIAIFAFFVVVAAIFHRRVRAGPKSLEGPLHFEKCMWVIYFTSGLILVRNIVRIAEFVEGFDGYIILHETFLYVFDAVPMAIVLAVFAVCYPSKLGLGKDATDAEHMQEAVEGKQ